MGDLAGYVYSNIIYITMYIIDIPVVLIRRIIVNEDEIRTWKTLLTLTGPILVLLRYSTTNTALLEYNV